jgi:hypothetical protein
MSDAVIEVLERARELSASDRQHLRDLLAVDAEMEIVAERMANPLPLRPWDEAMADILARIRQRSSGQ